MLQQLLPFLPTLSTQVEIWSVIAAAALGLILWVAGGRYTQPLMTLCAVFCGAIIGRHFSDYVGAGVEPCYLPVLPGLSFNASLA